MKKITGFVVAVILMTATAAHSSTLASNILSRIDRTAGVCVILGGDSHLAVSIAEGSQFVVYAKSLNPDAMAASADLAETAGLLGTRCFFSCGVLDSTPFVDNYIDLLVVDSSATITQSNLLSSLTPKGTLLYITGETITSELTKEFPASIDEWTHWYHAPDNNPISSDETMVGPYILSALSRPFYGSDPSVVLSAGGRMFRATGGQQYYLDREDEGVDDRNRLSAYQAYNGSLLWERTLDSNYRVYRSGMVAFSNAFYMIDGSGCLILNPEDGAQLSRLELSAYGEELKWMAIVSNTLYACLGDEDPAIQIPEGGRYDSREENSYMTNALPFGFGHTMVAWDIDGDQIVWAHSQDGSLSNDLIDSRAIGIYNNKLYYYLKATEVRCLNRLTGQSIWTNSNQTVIDKINGRAAPYDIFYGLSHNPPYRTMIGMLCGKDAVNIFIQARNNYVALDAQDGQLLWDKVVNRTGTVHEHPNSSLTSEDELLFKNAFYNAKTGVKTTGGLSKIDVMNCARITGTKKELFRARGLCYDLETKTDIDIGRQIRTDCRIGCIPAAGVFTAPPAGRCYCGVIYKGIGIYTPVKEDYLPTTNDQRLTVFSSESVTEVAAAATDWPCHRANTNRSMYTDVNVSESPAQAWATDLGAGATLTPPISVGSRLYVANEQGVVHCIDSDSGAVVWKSFVSGAVNYSPAYLDGRIFVGCLDGTVWAISAETGTILWRFRVAPAKQLIQVFGKIQSVCPVTRALVAQDGVVYVAAGGAHQNGFAIHALNASTGEAQWTQMHAGNAEEGDIPGDAASGGMVIRKGTLWLCGDISRSPVAFDLQTGEIKDFGRPADLKRDSPTGNIGVLGEKHLISGGQTYFKSVSTLQTVLEITNATGVATYPEIRINQSPRTMPLWDDSLFLRSDTACYNLSDVTSFFSQTIADAFMAANGVISITGNGWPAPLWDTGGTPLVLTKNKVIVNYRNSELLRLKSRETGADTYSTSISGYPIKDGCIVTSSGQIIICFDDGSLVCFE